ncbi:toll/interleukin-1 receptor domain-containing protein [uncultured Desulfobacter sp.]|uniref:toll/interleukin-1 receptor domain-containing protein n=1 Tax=uncultured Desulfobacter sp. TaxID=240139 RepID=UPI002AA7417D|nr:toll/interleukin-1 receptor domain-containing protein [uncultured Desulfobacter sp.]
MACNKEKRKIYASYCRKDDAAKSVIDALIEKASHTGCTICYDGNALPLGSSITKFMAELSEADRIVFLLSKQYFQSRSCMNELLLAYEKQASELQPAVVMLDGFLSDTDQDKKDAGELTTCLENADAVPVILAWLFGKYNPGFKYRDRLVLVLNDDTTCDQTAGKVIKWLDREFVPVRYTHLTAVKRRIEIGEAMGKFIKAETLNPLINLLALKFKYQKNDLTRFLMSIDDAEVLLDVLTCIGNFIDDLNYKSQFATGTLRGLVKQLTGLLLISAVDDKKLHQLIHELNYCAEGARSIFSQKGRDFYQILVSSFFNKPAVYEFDGDVLVGEGRIKLLEQGMDNSSFERFLKEEMEYMTEFLPLTKKVFTKAWGMEVDNPSVGTDEEQCELINEEMTRLGGFYIAVEKDWVNANFGGDNLLNKIGEKFPALVQILMEQKGSEEDILDLFIPGMTQKAFALQYKIISIYSKLERIG